MTACKRSNDDRQRMVLNEASARRKRKESRILEKRLATTPRVRPLDPEKAFLSRRPELFSNSIAWPNRRFSGQRTCRSFIDAPARARI